MKNTIETAVTDLQHTDETSVFNVPYVKGIAYNNEMGVRYSKYMQQRAKEFLDFADYSVVYNFFKKNFLREAQYDYIIVKARRAYMLARIFGIILLFAEEEQDNIESYKAALSKMHSDVYIYAKSFKKQQQKRLLILDDIIIHGRALNELVAYLTNNDIYSVQEIKVDSIVMSETAECVQPDLTATLDDNVKKVSVVEWKRLSNEIVTLIQVSGQSYASFTDSYLCEDGYELPDILYTLSNVINNARRIAGVTMDVAYDAIENDYAFAWSCTRLYTNTDKNAVIKKIAVPFVCLPLMTTDVWQAYINKFVPWVHDSDSVAVQSVSNTLLNEKPITQDTSKLLVGAYKYISNVATTLYAHTKQLKVLTTDNLYGSFGVTNLSEKDTKNISEMLKTMKQEYASQNNTTWLITEKDKYVYKTTTIDKTNIECETEYMYTLKSVSLWDEVLRKCNSKVTATHESISDDMLQRAMDTFLDELHSINEKNAKANLPRQQGIPIYALYTVLKCADMQYNWHLKLRSYNDFFAYVLSLWDVGIASYNVDVFTFNKRKYIGGCITDGEQAYHACLEKNSALEVYALHLLKYNSISTSDFFKKITALIEMAKYNIGDDIIDKERLINVAKYYTVNQSLQELYNMYPATEEQQKMVQSYVRDLY